MNYRRYLYYSFFLVILIFLLLALNADKFYFRLDLSRDQAFSISKYSKDILRTLPDDVELVYYLSPRLQTRIPAVQEISDILYEYQRISRGSFRVEIVNPESYTGTVPEDLGIAPRELQVTENNEQTFALVYSGMAMSYRDSVSVIPLIVNSVNLEYEITSRLLSMTQDKQLSVVIMQAKNESNPQLFNTMNQYLGQYYNVTFLQGGDTIPPTADGLVVLGMSRLDEANLYEIEQFILSGKGVLIATEAAEVDVQNQLQALVHEEHPLLDMLAHYGVEIGNSWVLDGASLILPVQEQRGNVIVNTYQPYPPWIEVLATQANSGHPVSFRFQGLDLFWASPITLREDLEAEVLFSSSPESVLSDGFLTDPASMAAAMFQAQNTEGNYPLAVSVTGGLSAWFAEPPEQLTERGINYASPLRESEEGRLLVFGDSDFSSELYQTGNSSYNILLMQNIFEYLVGDEDLLEIRTRGGRNTSLETLSEPAGAFALALARVLSFGILPLLIVLFAVIRHNLRRRRSKLPLVPDKVFSNEDQKDE